jgi:hypothetical protein
VLFFSVSFINSQPLLIFVRFLPGGWASKITGKNEQYKKRISFTGELFFHGFYSLSGTALVEKKRG